MVTYEHVNEVVRNRCVKHKAKRWDSVSKALVWSEEASLKDQSETQSEAE